MRCRKYFACLIFVVFIQPQNIFNSEISRFTVCNFVVYPWGQFFFVCDAVHIMYIPLLSIIAMSIVGDILFIKYIHCRWRVCVCMHYLFRCTYWLTCVKCGKECRESEEVGREGEEERERERRGRERERAERRWEDYVVLFSPLHYVVCSRLGVHLSPSVGEHNSHICPIQHRCFTS